MMERLEKKESKNFVNCVYEKNNKNNKKFIDNIVELYVLLSNKTDDWEYDSEKMCSMKSYEILPQIKLLVIHIEDEKKKYREELEDNIYENIHKNLKIDIVNPEKYEEIFLRKIITNFDRNRNIIRDKYDDILKRDNIDEYKEILEDISNKYGINKEFFLYDDKDHIILYDNESGKLYPFYVQSLIGQFSISNYINKYTREKFDDNL